ncbi:MAG TPA: diaminopimelate decarboxylase [Solirubrobacteraceae bacterium]|nr:diaminopimelate decarboxylase [Solirubrobacteraceae bacterium]
MTAASVLSPLFPLDSRLDERGRLELGGCDALELAREFGTPAYIVVEEDLRARARAFTVAAAAADVEHLHVVYASKAFPCTAVLSLFAQEGLYCDVASGGELHLALAAGFQPECLVVHGNARSAEEFDDAVRVGAGLIVLDNLDDVDKLTAAVQARGANPHPVLLRIAPDVKGETHEKISTGQADTKFGFSMAEASAVIERVSANPHLRLRGLHAHIGSQLLDLAPFRAAARALGTLGAFPVCDLGGGLGAAYAPDQTPPSIEEYVAALAGAAREFLPQTPKHLLIEPGRALAANGVVTLYTVQSVKHNVRTWVGVDGGMSDNLRPMLYGSRYEAHVVDRMFGRQPCRVVGKHCESGDVIVPDARLDDPRPGDVLVTPATGAYGFAMANNYNGVPRPPVIFVGGGGARVVVRRETYADLLSRDVAP